MNKPITQLFLLGTLAMACGSVYASNLPPCQEGDFDFTKCQLTSGENAEVKEVDSEWISGEADKANDGLSDEDYDEGIRDIFTDIEEDVESLDDLNGDLDDELGDLEQGYLEELERIENEMNPEPEGEGEGGELGGEEPIEPEEPEVELPMCKEGDIDFSKCQQYTPPAAEVEEKSEDWIQNAGKGVAGAAAGIVGGMVVDHAMEKGKEMAKEQGEKLLEEIQTSEAYKSVVGGAGAALTSIASDVMGLWEQIEDALPAFESMEEGMESTEDAQDNIKAVIEQLKEIASMTADQLDAMGIGPAAVEGAMKSMQADAVNMVKVGTLQQVDQKAPYNIIDEMSYAVLSDIPMGITAVFDCAQYKILGICWSVRWTWYGPKFATNIISENYTRDTHIEVRDSKVELRSISVASIIPTMRVDHTASSGAKAPTGALVGGITTLALTTIEDGMLTPLTEMISFVGGSGANWAAGGVSKSMTQTYDQKRSPYLTREVMVTGNIEGVMYDFVVGHVFNMFGWCRSPNLPAVPYYYSPMDWFSWKWMPTSETFLSALYYVSNGLDDIGGFGSVMPRTGRIQTADNRHASIIAAARGFHITTGNKTALGVPMTALAGLHVAAPMGHYSPGSWTSGFYTIKKGFDNIKMEMIWPQQENKCKNWSHDETGSVTSRANVDFMDENPYASAAFKGYRPFRCCRRWGNHIADITWMSPAL
ncbi:hypothetical protein [Vibrio barjaei]|uniref:hypothetical protein n=1 Tax=Vibrio barjaei TaxID=1676683 RepID=UPI0022846EC6|nr:hypothetical protein [Vibrio barjaei]MCY9872974.1 hypothetical protein [Vibrio barjaei]